jgi:large subunit ribosomal protein L4
MTGAKAWRQKGTGRARVGALGVPHRYGGGNAFATKPRSYTFKINRKERRKALRAALSVHADRGTIAVIDGSGFDKPSTKVAAGSLAKWGGKTPTLVVLGTDEENAAKSFRNIPRVRVALAGAAGVADVIGSASMVVSEAALKELEARTTEPTKTAPKAAPKKNATASKEPKASPKSPSGASEAPAKASQPGTPGSEAEDVPADGEAEDVAAGDGEAEDVAADDGEAKNQKGGE